MLSVAHQYALAAMELTDAQTTPEQVNAELGELWRVIASDRALGTFIASELVSPAQKMAVFNDALTGRTSELTRNLVMVLLRNRRGVLLRWVARAFDALLRQRSGLTEIEVVSAVELSAQQREKLAGLLAEKLGVRPELIVRVDPELLGGLRLRIGDELVDATVRGELNRMRQSLLAKRGGALDAQPRVPTHVGMPHAKGGAPHAGQDKP
jgi:ATP synthase F1 delta subunit